jgi:hypothetical protein
MLKDIMGNRDRFVSVFQPLVCANLENGIHQHYLTLSEHMCELYVLHRISDTHTHIIAVSTLNLSHAPRLNT